MRQRQQKHPGSRLIQHVQRRSGTAILFSGQNESSTESFQAVPVAPSAATNPVPHAPTLSRSANRPTDQSFATSPSVNPNVQRTSAQPRSWTSNPPNQIARQPGQVSQTSTELAANIPTPRLQRQSLPGPQLIQPQQMQTGPEGAATFAGGRPVTTTAARSEISGPNSHQSVNQPVIARQFHSDQAAANPPTSQPVLRTSGPIQQPRPNRRPPIQRMAQESGPIIHPGLATDVAPAAPSIQRQPVEPPPSAPQIQQQAEPNIANLAPVQQQATQPNTNLPVARRQVGQQDATLSTAPQQVDQQTTNPAAAQRQIGQSAAKPIMLQKEASPKAPPIPPATAATATTNPAGPTREAVNRQASATPSPSVDSQPAKVDERAAQLAVFRAESKDGIQKNWQGISADRQWEVLQRVKAIGEKYAQRREVEKATEAEQKAAEPAPDSKPTRLMRRSRIIEVGTSHGQPKISQPVQRFDADTATTTDSNSPAANGSELTNSTGDTLQRQDQSAKNGPEASPAGDAIADAEKISRSAWSESSEVPQSRQPIINRQPSSDSPPATPQADVAQRLELSSQPGDPMGTSPSQTIIPLNESPAASHLEAPGSQAASRTAPLAPTEAAQRRVSLEPNTGRIPASSSQPVSEGTVTSTHSSQMQRSPQFAQRSEAAPAHSIEEGATLANLPDLAAMTSDNSELPVDKSAEPIMPSRLESRAAISRAPVAPAADHHERSSGNVGQPAGPQRIPLQDAWPVENKAAPTSIQPPEISRSVDNSALLRNVAPGQPTSSSIEFVPPTRPRPNTLQAAPSTTSPSRLATQPTPTTQPSAAARPGSATIEPPLAQRQTTNDPTAIVQRQEAPSSNNQSDAGSIATNFGPLPADLWRHVGVEPPTAPANQQQRPAAPTGSSQTTAINRPESISSELQRSSAEMNLNDIPEAAAVEMPAADTDMADPEPNLLATDSFAGNESTTAADKAASEDQITMSMNEEEVKAPIPVLVERDEGQEPILLYADREELDNLPPSPESSAADEGLQLFADESIADDSVEAATSVNLSSSEADLSFTVFTDANRLQDLSGSAEDENAEGVMSVFADEEQAAEFFDNPVELICQVPGENQRFVVYGDGDMLDDLMLAADDAEDAGTLQAFPNEQEAQQNSESVTRILLKDDDGQEIFYGYADRESLETFINSADQHEADHLIDSLARQVYHGLQHRFEVERERRGQGNWR